MLTFKCLIIAFYANVLYFLFLTLENFLRSFSCFYLEILKLIPFQQSDLLEIIIHLRKRII